MKTSLILCGTAGLLAALLPPLHATGNFSLESAIYVFKSGDFHQVALPPAQSSGENNGVVLLAPGTARFDQVTLELTGTDCTWNGGRTAPEQFSLVAVPPKIVLQANQPASVFSSVPVQYMEPLENGKLELREIAADSPAAPHCRLTFTVSPLGVESSQVRLSCDLDIKTVRARAKLPGVALEVGKPLLAGFKDELKFTVRTDQWAAVLLQAPNGSDYSLLLLLKVAKETGAPTVLTKVADYHLKTARFGAVALAGGDFVYIVGGRNTGGTLGDIERFNVRTHEITVLTDKLTPRHHHGAALVNGKIYVYGGRGYELPKTSPFEAAVDIYDLATGKVTQGAPMPLPRANFATAVVGGRIYIFGGMFGQPGFMRQTNRTGVYDPATDAWSEGNPMPTPRETRAAVVVNDCIIVAGGHRTPNVSSGLRTVECYLPARDDWRDLPDLGQPVGAHSAAVLDDRLFLFGNFDPADQITSYDLTTHVTTLLRDGFTPASQTAAVAHQGMIYVVGGTGGGGRHRNDNDAIDAIQVFTLTPSPAR
ncbi:MAG: Kelch repeat-containing protein [Opitutales bacterium]